MGIDEEGAFSTYMQQLSAGLAAAAAANAECMMPSGTDKDIEKLSESIQRIAHLPKDAKARHRKELEEIIYEIDSILQLFSLKGGSDKIPCNRRANPRTAQEVKAIRTRMDKILKKPQFLSNHIRNTDNGISKMTVTQSPVEPVILLGKNEDKEKLIELLLSAKETGQAGPCIIPIDRKGEGEGGTTELARAIFDNKRVAHHFRRKMWVNAAELVDSKKLSGLISKPASTMFWVHKTLNNDMEEEQVLLVLDDIRNKNVEYKKACIREIKKPCINTKKAEGRWKVVISTVPPRYYGLYNVQGSVERLSEKDSWMLFKEYALHSEKECVFARCRGDVHLQLEAIGENIVKNLQGSRQMIIHIGWLLSEKHEPSYWKLIQESQVWKLPVDREVIQHTLQSCYRPLPQ